MKKMKCWRKGLYTPTMEIFDKKNSDKNISISKGFKGEGYSVKSYEIDKNMEFKKEKKLKTLPTKSQALTFAQKYMRAHDKC